MLGKYSKNDLGGKGPFGLPCFKHQHAILIFMVFLIHFFLLALKPMGVLNDLRPVVASFFGISGILISWLSCYLVRGLITIVRDYVPASAIVIDYAPAYKSGVYLVVKYADKGSSYTVTTLNKSGMTKRGKKVNILFNPKDLSEVFVKNSALYSLPFLVSVMGMGFLFGSFYFIRETLTR